MNCLRGDDHREGGITDKGWSAVDERVGSGQECSRCGEIMPWLATIRLLPDGNSTVHADSGWPRSRKGFSVERREQTLVNRHALVYISIGCDREVGLEVTANGKVRVWVHDDPHGDGIEPSATWEHEAERRLA